MNEYREKVFTPGNVITSDSGDIICKIERSCRFIAFHSGEHEPDYSQKWFSIEDEDGFKSASWKECSTTNIEVLSEEIKKAKKSNQMLIVFSTYHSCFKLNKIKFNTTICDESHFIVQENFHNNFKKIASINKYFFTATERHTYSDRGRGLNNTEFYGKLLYSITPAELQKKGYITGIKLHIEEFSTVDREATYISEVIDAIDKNTKLSSKLPKFKVLVSTPGTAYIKIVEDNIDKFNKYGCPIFTISSKNGSRINGKEIKRDEFLENVKKAENAIIFHYDILAEGIDIDGITGVVINRNMSKSKALQTFGRAMRIYKANPELKPYAWITITCLNGDKDMIEFFKELIDELAEEGYDPKDIFEDTNNPDKHIGDDESIDDAYGNNRASSSNSLAKDIEHFIYDKKMTIALAEFEKIDINDMEQAFNIIGKLFKEI